MRKPFQGVLNVIRFNWHFFLSAAILIAALLYLYPSFDPLVSIWLQTIAIVLICSTIMSLLVSAYVYDFSNLYSFAWFTILDQRQNQKIANVNAGFDETSIIIKRKFPTYDLVVLDFYDPDSHTEISIKRARKAYPPFPGTLSVNTLALRIESKSFDKIFCIFSAHEIRNDAERILFFRELGRVLSDKGEIIVTEHLRDIANFLAYNIGSFHFHSKITWSKTFREAGLNVSSEIKITPFITSFILKKNATSN